MLGKFIFGGTCSPSDTAFIVVATLNRRQDSFELLQAAVDSQCDKSSDKFGHYCDFISVLKTSPLFFIGILSNDLILVSLDKVIGTTSHVELDGLHYLCDFNFRPHNR